MMSTAASETEATGIARDLTTKRVDNEAVKEFDWNDDPENPYNWPRWRKTIQLVAIAVVSLTASIGSSIISPAHQQLIEDFGVSSTAAFLPLTTYVLALGLGPVLGGPLSETAGRNGVFISAAAFGGLFALGAGFSPSFAGLCILRFLSGFAYGPSLAIGTGFLAEVYKPVERGMPSALLILCPFLGPGLGPVLGVFLVERMNWRWTQFTLVFFSVFSLAWFLLGKESYHPVIKRRRLKQLGMEVPDAPSFLALFKELFTTGLFRPVHMMFTEPIVGFICLYIAFIFGVIFIFFGALFYVFQTVYGYTTVQAGLVFLAIVVGCVIGVINVGVCNKVFYLPQVSRFPANQVPPEYRLFPAMVGSIALPASIFLFGWTARADISAALPILAIVIYGAGNISLFISSLQYFGDVYHLTNIASAGSANSLARYTLAAVFPLFSLQLYENLGVAWASSLLGFIAIALLPLPWLFFKFGKQLRSRSRYQTASY